MDVSRRLYEVSIAVMDYILCISLSSTLFCGCAKQYQYSVVGQTARKSSSAYAITQRDSSPISMGHVVRSIRAKVRMMLAKGDLKQRLSSFCLYRADPEELQLINTAELAP